MTNFALYHYVHCPFCIRVRMAFGFLKTPYSSHVLSYDDEKTPIDLTGKKMLPILKTATLATNESLDIIRLADSKNVLKANQDLSALEPLLNKLGDLVHSLAMPYWVYTKEFSPEARAYFEKKKSVKRGPFHLLAQRRAEFEKPLLQELKNLESALNPFFESKELTIKDIMLASHVWGLYVVPEFTFPEKWQHYLQEVKNICHFNYHEDFWRKA